MIRPLSPHDSPAVIEQVKKLLSHALFQPNGNQLNRIISAYQTEKDRILYLCEKENRVLGILGLVFHKDRGEILHIAVEPTNRGQGIGRQMIDEMERKHALLRISAETDKEAVHFYEKCGFQIVSLGEKYPGTERFYCERFAR